MSGTIMEPFKAAKRRFERTYVITLLHTTQGNIAKAAKIAGKDRKDFYDLMRRCGVAPGAFRPGWGDDDEAV